MRDMFSVLGMSYTWLWLILAIVFGVIEAMTLGIVSIWFAIGAFITMLLTLIIDSFLVQLIIFILISIVLVATTRQIAVKKLKVGQYKTNIDELIGKEAMVVKKILPYEAGEVKVEGKIWRAISDSKQIYEVSQIGTILRIEGVTIILK